MATILEELQLKLGIDQSQVGPGLTSFKQKVEAATEGAKKAFEKVEHSGRGFHKVMHKITEASPVMGGAMQMALNPIGGTLIAATLAFAYFNKKMEEGNERLEGLGRLSQQRFGDVKAAARDAAREVDEFNRKFAEANGKDAAGRGERDQKNAFEKGLKDTESAAGRKEARLDRSKELALGNVAAKEKSGALSKDDAAAQRDVITNDYDITKRQLQVEAEKAKLAAHKKAGADAMREGRTAESEIVAAHEDVLGRAASGPMKGLSRAERLKRAQHDKAANEKNISGTEAELEKAREWQKSVQDRIKDAGNNPLLKAKAGFEFQSEVNATGGFLPNQLVDMLEGTLKKQRAFGGKNDSQAEKLADEQKRAEARETAAREKANKIEASVNEHGLAAQDSERRIHDLGDVKSYKSLGTLAKGGDKRAQQLMALQARDNPMDASRIAQLQDSLSRSGLQPTKEELNNPLNRAMTSGGSLRVEVMNMD